MTRGEPPARGELAEIAHALRKMAARTRDAHMRGGGGYDTALLASLLRELESTADWIAGKAEREMWRLIAEVIGRLDTLAAEVGATAAAVDRIDRYRVPTREHFDLADALPLPHADRTHLSAGDSAGRRRMLAAITDRGRRFDAFDPDPPADGLPLPDGVDGHQLGGRDGVR
ncbi:MAG TPA: hypothetical protein VFR11_18305 [Micromonosporaceae bacterium]|nr:hypothetical protein [Micromonosporaceae bacterium]